MLLSVLNRRLDMLPSLLSETVCSLRARVDRLTLSVIFVLDSTYRVRPELTWRGRSVIRSRYSLTYEQADRMLSGACVARVPVLTCCVRVRCCRGAGHPADPPGEEKPWLWDSPDGGITGASVSPADEPELRAALEVCGSGTPRASVIFSLVRSLYVARQLLTEGARAQRKQRHAAGSLELEGE